MQDVSAKLFIVIATVLAVAGCDRQQAEPPVDTPVVNETAASPMPQAVELSRTPSAANARAFFITPVDGDVVANPITIEFGIEGMQIVMAGDESPLSGHHHLLVDTDLPDLDQPIPADAQHIHFGKGNVSTTLTLEPGEHTLRLLLGDHRHIPHDPPVVSPAITITVE
jgi:hypothetical protein